MPWNDVQTVELGQAEIPTILADFKIDGCQFLFAGTHPVPPGSRFLTDLRNDQLLKLALLVANRNAAAILVGDLNTTDHSPCFRQLLTRARLRDTRQGFGVQPSWGPFQLLEIPIDHCLVSPHIAVRRRRVGPHLGSDHRPVAIDLQLPAPQ